MSREYKCERIWAYIRKCDSVTTPEVAKHTGISADLVSVNLSRFANKGFLVHVSGKGIPGDPKRYEKTPFARPVFGNKRAKLQAKRKFSKSDRQMLWNNMKITRKFTVTDLLSSIDVTPQVAERFINALSRAGYLAPFKVRGQQAKVLNNGYEAVWILVRDTGRLAPKGRRSGLWDQNEKTFYPYRSEAETKSEARNSPNKELAHVMAR